MRKTFALLAAVAATVTPTVGMASEGQQSFRHDGFTYVYTTKAVQDHKVITGRRYPSGTPFRFVVHRGTVSGTANGYPVSFSVADAAGATERPTQLASR